MLMAIRSALAASAAASLPPAVTLRIAPAALPPSPPPPPSPPLPPPSPPLLLLLFAALLKASVAFSLARLACSSPARRLEKAWEGEREAVRELREGERGPEKV